MIETRGHSGDSVHRLEPAACARWLRWALGCWLCVGSGVAHAGPLVTTDSPIGFFTNVASRLLQSQLGLSLNHIQVYPTNQYTPSVHRLLQVTANLYDALTNSPATGYPYLPSVFRPVFANYTSRSGGEIFISGFEEVTDTNLLSHIVADLSDAKARQNLRPHDMVCGIPLVIGAKKGYPNFNDFAMHTHVRITRKLHFVRQNGQNDTPISQTNQMFLVGISNVLGAEAWNSYTANFPRPLRLYVWPDIQVLMTNENNTVLNPPPQRYKPLATILDATNWPGFYLGPGQEPASFILPLSTNLVFLTNSTYQYASAQFVPASGTFEQVAPAFFIPHWWLNVKTLLRFALVDTSVNRIVDYVNLSDQVAANLTDALTWGGQCGDTYTPSASYGSLWCTNHYPTIANENLPTYGILNQMAVCLGEQPYYYQADWNSAINDAPPGMSKEAGVDFFRAQFNLAPLFTHGTTFYKSNVFNAVFQPLRNIYLLTSWQANDPLVHYTVSDLTDLTHTSVVFDKFNPIAPDPVVNLGLINSRYEPWGGGPYSSSSRPTTYDLTVKDPAVMRSDYWDFPTNQTADASWLGRVHRGTPWQTIYLKAPAPSLTTWMQWTGDTQLMTNWNGFNGVTWDAAFSHPTNDWRLASLVISLLSTNDPHNLRSLNQPTVPAWCGVLDGMVALTNTADGPLAPVIMWSNSPQALTIATALNALRASQPGQYFHDAGDLLAAPELSTVSPWLDLSSAGQLDTSLTDAAYEAIPLQLLPLLRPDSVGFAHQTGGTLGIQFTGTDGLAYAVQTSSNLWDWVTVSTNYPTNGTFTFSVTLPPDAPRRYYRSVIWP